MKFSLCLRKHRVSAAVLILVCALTARVFLAWEASVTPAQLVASLPDAATYIAPAESLLGDASFRDYTGQPDVTRTPGYPIFLAALILVFGANLHVVLVVQAIVLSFTTLVLYCLARRILPPVMAFVAGLLAASSPWAAVLAGLPLSDGLFLLLLLLILVLIKLIAESGSFRKAFLGGVALGVITAGAVLTRPIVPLVLLVLITLMWQYGVGQKHWLVIAIVVICALTPLLIWQHRNLRVGELNSISDISGKTLWRYLAARVSAEADGGDRWRLSQLAYLSEKSWAVSNQKADEARWHNAMMVFKAHPWLTAYSFFRSAFEHAIHPSPDVLSYAKLNFQRDYIVLAVLWTSLLSFAAFGMCCKSQPSWDDGAIERDQLLIMVLICGSLTLSSGVSFGAGARLRAPLELVVPLLASVGLIRFVHACLHRFLAYKLSQMHFFERCETTKSLS